MELTALRTAYAAALTAVAQAAALEAQFTQAFAEGYTLTAHQTNDDIQLAHSNQVIGMTSAVAVQLRDALLIWFPL